MLTKLFNKRNRLFLIFYCVWLLIGLGVIGWMLYLLQEAPTPAESDVSISTFDEAQLLEATELVSKDELTSNVPTVTVNIEPEEASESADIIIDSQESQEGR